MLFLLSLLSFSTAKPPDPWGRPSHARVITEAPKQWSDLFSAETRYAFFWNEAEEKATIQVRGTLRWKTIARDVHSGWSSPKLPKGSIFRIKLTNATRSSPLLEAAPWYSPSDLAQLHLPENATLATSIGEMTGEKNKIYAASLTGGLIEISEQGLRNWTRWDGLPSDRVLSVAADGDRILVGTAEGMALFKGGQLWNVWDDELSDPYVQSVAISQEDYLAGTYRGLDRIRAETVSNLLPKWSIFSLLAQQDGVLWAGYEGITRWSTDDQYATQEWPGNVYAIELTPKHMFLATEQKGLVSITEEGTNIILDKEITGLAYDGVQVWSAAGAAGLRNQEGERIKAISGSVWSVEAQDQQLWVGTANGIQRFTPTTGELQRYPISPWPADVALNDILPREGGAILAHQEGISLIATPHPSTNTLDERIQEEIISVLEDEHNLYALGREKLYTLFPDGRVQITQLKGTATSAALFLQRIWISTTAGLLAYHPSDDQLNLVDDRSDILRLSSSRQALWAISRTGELFDVKPTQLSLFGGISLPLSIAPSGLATCVGTEDGLFRIWKGRENPVEDVLQDQDRNVAVYAVAADEKQGCWMAGEDGSIGRIDAQGDSVWLRLNDPELPKITRIIPQGDQAWILTESGSWLVSLQR